MEIYYFLLGIFVFKSGVSAFRVLFGDESKKSENFIYLLISFMGAVFVVLLLSQ